MSPVPVRERFANPYDNRAPYAVVGKIEKMPILQGLVIFSG